MERLTERWGEDDVWVKDHDYVTAAYRLAAYEDTGLTPERCAEFARADAEGRYIVMRDAEQEGVARLRELAEADKDGRLAVLPCKVGDTVYWVHGAVITECKVYRVQKNRNGLYICLKSKKSHGAFRTDLSIGKTVFLTREEAEKALEAKRDVCP
jgi:hypothetical protein